MLVPTTLGVLSYSCVDLSVPPEMLPSDPSAPPGVAGIYPVHGGVATLSPQGARPPQRSTWCLQWYAPAP